MRTEDKEPYQLHEIKFTRDQVVWCLEHLILLRNGFWPESEDCRGSSQAAYFRTPAELAAEIDQRLEMTGTDGAMAELHYTNGRTLTSIAKQYNLRHPDAQGRELVKRWINQAVAYMSGWRRKRRTYKEWREHRKKAALKRQNDLE